MCDIDLRLVLQSWFKVGVTPRDNVTFSDVLCALCAHSGATTNPPRRGCRTICNCHSSFSASNHAHNVFPRQKDHQINSLSIIMACMTRHLPRGISNSNPRVIQRLPSRLVLYILDFVSLWVSLVHLVHRNGAQNAMNRHC